MGNSKNLRIFNFVILLENDNESTNQDDVTTDHEADVFGDTRCKIDQWRSILRQASQDKNLWPTDMFKFTKIISCDI